MGLSSATRRAPQRGGAGKCATCSHPRLTEIDAALVAETPFRQIAKVFGISTRSLVRHRDAHLGKERVVVKAPRRALAVTSLERIERLYAGLVEIWEKAEELGQTGQMLATSRELRAAIELLAKLTGELNEREQHLTVNMLADEGFMKAIGVVLDELNPHPEIKQAIVRRLRVLNGG